MAVTIAQFLRVCDRLAKQRDMIGDAITSVNVNDASGRKYWEEVLVTDDYDFINRLQRSTRHADVGMTRDSVIGDNTTGVSVSHYNWFGDIINGLLDWLVHDNDTTLDAYLASETEQVSEYFDDLHFVIKRIHLHASVVFCEQTFTLGDIEVEAGPVLTFTDGTRLGIGSGYAGGTGATRNYAPARFKAVVTTQPIGATDLDVTVTCTKPDGSSENKDVVIPSGSAVDTEVLIGDVTDVYLDLTNVAYTAGGDEGTVGDTVTFRHVKHRAIEL